MGLQIRVKEVRLKPMRVKERISVKKMRLQDSKEMRLNEAVVLRSPSVLPFFHMLKDANHKSMGIWLLFARMAVTDKKKKTYFVVNDVPIRYSMREHALMSGLHCYEFPERYKDRIGSPSFVKKHFKNKRVTQKAIEEKFVSLRSPTNDRLKMVVLCFITFVIKGSGKRGSHATQVDAFLTKIVADLDACWTFPWGRYTFFNNVYEITRMMKFFNGVAKVANLPGFIIPMELLAFEVIPYLMGKYREKVKDAVGGCPRMCKSKFKYCSLKGYNIKEINKALGETKLIHSILASKPAEHDLIRQISEEDDVIDTVVDGWCKHLLVDKKRVLFEEMYKQNIKVREEARLTAEASHEL